jgi:tripartite-type tricarboxylate transporter receptor subunit TctC
MKANQVNFALPGSGSTGHLTTALMLREANLKATLVPYRGAAPAMADILGDHVDLYFATPQQAAPLVSSGKIKAYAVTSKDKMPQFPDAASFVEALGPKFEIHYWHALFAPAGTPRPIIDKLNGLLQAAEEDPALVKSWADSGVSPYPKEERSPEAARAILKSEIVRWGQVVRDNDIQPE